MSELAILLRSYLIGLAIAAPVGPIGFLCIRRTLLHGRAVGFLSGLGAATADACYAAIAGFGLAAVSRFLLIHATPLHLAGGLFLMYLGARSIFAKHDTPPMASPITGRLSGYGSTFLLTLTNPMTIVMFAGVFAAMTPPRGLDYGFALITIAGVFLGSATWWWVLSAAVGAFRSALGPRALRWIDRVAGGIISSFGLATVARA